MPGLEDGKPIFRIRRDASPGSLNSLKGPDQALYQLLRELGLRVRKVPVMRFDKHHHWWMVAQPPSLVSLLQANVTNKDRLPKPEGPITTQTTVEEDERDAPWDMNHVAWANEPDWNHQALIVSCRTPSFLGCHTTRAN